MPKTKIFELCLFSLLLIAASTYLIMTGCGTSRSSMITDPTCPKVCKMQLECTYAYQSSEGKAACMTTFGVKCAKALDYTFCQDQYKTDVEIKTCIKLKD